MLSFWEHDTFFAQINFAVIGSGIVGLNAALALRQARPHARIVVLERGMLPWGASTRNAGFACFGSTSELLDDLSHTSRHEVTALVQMRWQGLARLRELLGDRAIGYQHCGGYEVFAATDQPLYDQCIAQLPDLQDLVGEAIGITNVFRIDPPAARNMGIGGAAQFILNREEGQLHTGNLMAALLDLVRRQGIAVYNGFEVAHLNSGSTGVEIVATNGVALRADRVLVATNGFTPRLLPDIADLQPARNQVLITEPIEGLRLNGCFHHNRGYNYFRNVGNRILLGGGRDTAFAAEATDQFGTTEGIRQHLTRLLHEVVAPHHQPTIAQWWSGILGVGSQKTPIIRPLTDRLAVAVRMGGMGVAIGSLVGKAGADCLLSG